MAHSDVLSKLRDKDPHSRYQTLKALAVTAEEAREPEVRKVAVRICRRDKLAYNRLEAMNVLRHAGLTVDQAEAIYRLTALSDLNERYVMPPIQREEAIEDSGCPPEYCKGSCGLGCSSAPERGM